MKIYEDDVDESSTSSSYIFNDDAIGDGDNDEKMMMMKEMRD